MKKAILDVDTGVDDALAIIYAYESGQLDLLGITTVNGNVPLEDVVRNTKKVAQLIGDDRLKVYRGAERPLLKEIHSEYKVHGSDGIGGALGDMTVTKEEEEEFASDFIIEQARKNPGELTLIMVGPLTNLALALRKEPKIAGWIDQVVVMGGLISKAGHGNTLPTSEFNIYADAEAAKAVFHAGFNLKLVSLDVTLETFMNRDTIERLKGTKYHDFVLKSTEIYRDYSSKRFGMDGCALHDPLTVGAVLDPTFLKTEKHFVDVETKSDLSYGQTICDFRNLWDREPNVEISLGVEGKRFVDHFIGTLKV
ncbi:MAG TPA: nucleoside hydrolase [Candidatus Salinicoccus stercoripullorum]|uniref:Nucleoside hydrolase n=1 Tax=Candidatus Salinicoccus stercoripullorum TaxID=2838756 RepID=A0A9D1QGE6_9STAP|nr:nucleoside hydrolase [Candidatus Salinicoccus stercoripullorum]